MSKAMCPNCGDSQQDVLPHPLVDAEGLLRLMAEGWPEESAEHARIMRAVSALRAMILSSAALQ
jgi:hypothetical protein